GGRERAGSGIFGRGRRCFLLCEAQRDRCRRGLLLGGGQQIQGGGLVNRAVRDKPGRGPHFLLGRRIGGGGGRGGAPLLRNVGGSGLGVVADLLQRTLRHRRHLVEAEIEGVGKLRDGGLALRNGGIELRLVERRADCEVAIAHVSRGTFGFGFTMVSAQSRMWRWCGFSGCGEPRNPPSATISCCSASRGAGGGAGSFSRRLRWPRFR